MNVRGSQNYAIRYLGQLPHDGDAPADAVMSNDEGLHSPAPIVAEGEPVDMAPESLEGDVPAVNAVLLFAIDGVVRHLGVEPDDDVANSLQ